MLPDLSEFANRNRGSNAICVIWEIGEEPLESLYAVVGKTLDRPAFERYDRLFWEKDRKRYLCSHFLRRALLSKLTGVPKDEILFATNRFGKPYPIYGGSHWSAEKWNFNVSSSGNRVAFVATDSGQCGIDVETFSGDKRQPDLKQMSKSDIFSAREKEFLIYGPGSLEQRFYQIWTLKEAYLKYTGRGLGDIENTDMFDLMNLQLPMKDGRWVSDKGDAAAFHSSEESYALSVVVKRDQAMPQVHILNNEQVFSLANGTFPGKRKSDSHA